MISEILDRVGSEMTTGGDAWLSPAVPPVVPAGRTAVAVLAVIDDPRFRDQDDPFDKPFVDVANYWSTDRWTVTLQCRASDSAEDIPVRVAGWMPLPTIDKVIHTRDATNDVDYDDVVSACDAHGITLPVEAIEPAVLLINHFGRRRLSDRVRTGS
ncbi:hypothetical protein [Burkholderia glumae]|uniref:hypothetical protein n=1 Tax=Burkholderia glumae TaxID=337 RepID=UPI0020CDCDD4|nr:hypothetical protein [Burkholderia glumae]MCQ0031502.1 hypothetical protein [Burkholderia glumae]MCQ0035154.1 hypothetical protein [Burkholderia glumae]MCR1769800.1 hypothetical protein [Burkholderia glumae]